MHMKKLKAWRCKLDLENQNLKVLNCAGVKFQANGVAVRLSNVTIKQSMTASSMSATAECRVAGSY